jgi:aryl-alcohol dehydrogenase-like predicted oxidoreductase
MTGRDFADDDFRSKLPRFSPAAMAANQALVDSVTDIAARHSATPAQVALAWVLAQGPRVVPIPGTKRVSRLEENAAAAALILPAEDLRLLDELPPAAGSRY